MLWPHIQQNDHGALNASISEYMRKQLTFHCFQEKPERKGA